MILGQTDCKGEKMTKVAASKERVKIAANDSLTFQNNSFKNILSKCQAVWIQIRPVILLGLIWVWNVCRGYQQTTPAGKELVNMGQIKTAADDSL